MEKGKEERKDAFVDKAKMLLKQLISSHNRTLEFRSTKQYLKMIMKLQTALRFVSASASSLVLAVVVSGLAFTTKASAQALPAVGGTQIQDAIQNGPHNIGSNNQWLGQHGDNLGNQTIILRQHGTGNLGLENQALQQSGVGNIGTQLQSLGQLGNYNQASQDQYLQQHGARNIGVQLQGITQYGPGNLGIQDQTLRQYGVGNGAIQQQNLVQGGYYDPTQIQRALQSGNGNQLQQNQNFLQAH